MKNRVTIKFRKTHRKSRIKGSHKNHKIKIKKTTQTKEIKKAILMKIINLIKVIQKVKERAMMIIRMRIMKKMMIKALKNPKKSLQDQINQKAKIQSHKMRKNKKARKRRRFRE